MLLKQTIPTLSAVWQQRIISHLRLKSTASWPQLCALRVSGFRSSQSVGPTSLPGERKRAMGEPHDGSLCSTWKRHMVLPLRFLWPKQVSCQTRCQWVGSMVLTGRGCRRDIRLSEQTTPNATEPLTELVLLSSVTLQPTPLALAIYPIHRLEGSILSKESRQGKRPTL